MRVESSPAEYNTVGHRIVPRGPRTETGAVIPGVAALSGVPRSVIAMKPLTSTQHGGLRLVAVRDSLWRVIARDDRIVGHLERLDTAEGSRYLAKRFITSRASFASLGEFWSADEAIDCLHCL